MRPSQNLADRIGIEAVYSLVAWLPALGIMTALLPRRRRISLDPADPARV